MTTNKPKLIKRDEIERRRTGPRQPSGSPATPNLDSVKEWVKEKREAARENPRAIFEALFARPART